MCVTLNLRTLAEISATIKRGEINEKLDALSGNGQLKREG